MTEVDDWLRLEGGIHSYETSRLVSCLLVSACWFMDLVLVMVAPDGFLAGARNDKLGFIKAPLALSTLSEHLAKLGGRRRGIEGKGRRH